MSNSDLVRFSRDGDQFHYVWAARRCLPLLSPVSGLVAVTIEGPSHQENGIDPSITDGEELIDIAEYYGSQQFENAESVKYYQLKHSTKHSNIHWTSSGLAKTLKGFSVRYQNLLNKFGSDFCDQKLEFYFVSNRPVSSEVIEAIADISSGSIPRHPKELIKLKKYIGLNGEALSRFCRILRIEGQQDGYIDQRSILVQDISGYLPDGDVDAPVQLKELITRKALSESAGNPAITKIDVLRALKTDESSLFPAPCLITEPDNFIAREQELTLISEVINANFNPLIIHANGGIGKSVFSTRIQHDLPHGSLCILYDCFGNGQYRSPSSFRHRHKDALVQICNELASMGVCHPLIPTTNADVTAYLKAFKYRLTQSIRSLRSKNKDAILCIVIDAADNAQMAAEEIGESRSFAMDLLRDNFSDGVRIVMTCRTHRQEKLDPPVNTVRRELLPFSKTETGMLLRRYFPDATDHDIEEFHRLSSQNPRVQITALSSKGTLSEILRRLGPNPTTAEATIASLLDHAIKHLRDKAGKTERAHIDLICYGLAILRPLIPIKVLASISGVEADAVRSFAVDLGRPLMVAGETIQFFDEPAETWFREQFKPDINKLAGFITTLKPLASKSAYVAATLPQLMLEAGQFSELVQLALSSESLPEGSSFEKRDVELQRLQFALKASLRAKRYSDAAKLALKAGGETAGEGRQESLIQGNTDLAAVFMEAGLVQELVSRRTFGGGWLGSHHVYEAGILSEVLELRGDARSRLRMAQEWLKNWASLKNEEREKERIEDADIAEMAMAHLNIHGADAAANSLLSWTPCDISYRGGKILARRLVDHGRYSHLDELAVAARNDLGLILAITTELRLIHRSPPCEVVERALRLLLNSRVKISQSQQYNQEGNLLAAICSLVEAANQHLLKTYEKFALLIERYMPDVPPRGLSSRFNQARFTYLRAYSLKAALNGLSLELNELADPELRKELEKQNTYSDSHDAREFKEVVGALLPWHKLWVSVFLRKISDQQLTSAIEDALSTSSKAVSAYYREESQTSDEMALLWLDILLMAGGSQSERIDKLNSWMASLKRPLYTSTFINFARITARHLPFQEQAYNYARKSFDLINEERVDAESKSISYIEIARSVLTLSVSEAKEYFDQAIKVASNIGDEHLDRWSSILSLADQAACPSRPVPEIAYKLSRCAELTYEYVVRDKYFEWESTVKSMAALCPTSSITILSRWRDRNFGRTERLLPEALKFLVENRGLSSLIPIALIGFSFEWEEVDLLNSALSSCEKKPEKEEILNYLYRYMQLGEHSASTWREMAKIASSFDLTIAGINEVIEYSEKKEVSSKKNDSTYKSLKREAKRDWDTVFSEIDLSNPNEISVAYHRFRSSEAPNYLEQFFKEACTRATIGKEDEFVRALSEVAEFTLYELRIFLEQLTENWRQRLSIKSALRETLIAFCKRYCMDIHKSRYYEALPLTFACEVAGWSEIELVDVILNAIAETTEELSSSRLFTLTDLLAVKLNADDALDVLNFGLDLFDSFLKDEDGDGLWSIDIVPPININTAIAGYIWAALSASSASLRWQAAHTVRGLCRLNLIEVLDELINLAKIDKGGPFVDKTLHFYNLHALQWLLIALERSARDYPKAVIPYAAFLTDIALHGNSHVLMRDFAARAVIALTDSGELQLEETIKVELNAVNKSKLPLNRSKKYQRRKHGQFKKSGSNESKFYFGIDMGAYWFTSLGRCFAMTQAEIEHEAAKVIVNEWNLGSYDNWKGDIRAQRRIYPDKETYHSHGSYPRTDDLRFYLSYHAMMIVAGKLLLTHSLHQDTNEPDYDEFKNWLYHHNLTRQDRGWISDRRDPQPLEWPNWKNEGLLDEWPWSVQSMDFDRALRRGDQQLNLWGHWTNISGNQIESININSALVSRNSSDALLRALQTTIDSHNYRIPDAEDDLQIDHGEFRLNGWVVDRDRTARLDEYDPWAGDVGYPPLAPARFITEELGLLSKSEKRIWCRRMDEKNVIWSELWGRHQSNNDYHGVESGNRLRVDIGFLKELLQKLNNDLIVEVELTRTIHKHRYENDKEDDFGYTPPYTRIYLIRPDGQISTI